MKNNYFLLGASLLVLILGILLLMNLGFVDLFTGRATSQGLDINVSVGNGTAPQIYNITVDNNWAVTLNLGPSPTYVVVNFSVNDSNGYQNIDRSTANATLHVAGYEHRYNITCQRTQASGYDANFSCKVPLYWYDGSANWVVNVSISDLSSNKAYNYTTTVSVGTLTGFEMGPGNITFATLSAGSYNQTATNDPLLLNNTGNVNITNSSIAINATNLVGESDGSKAIWAANFSVGLHTGSSQECNIGDGFSIATRMNMSYGSFTNINNSLLTVGNYTRNNGIGQENLSLCILEIGSELSQQAYSSNRSWTVKIA